MPPCAIVSEKFTTAGSPLSARASKPNLTVAQRSPTSGISTMRTDGWAARSTRLRTSPAPRPATITTSDASEYCAQSASKRVPSLKGYTTAGRSPTARMLSGTRTALGITTE